MIVNIRGTNGSGKSTVVREVMKSLELLVISTNVEQRIIGYSGGLNGRTVSIVGRYETACGGCDTIKSQDEIQDRVRNAAHFGSVLFEGIIVSDIYARYVEFSKEYPEQFVFAYLNTPLDVCIERVMARRAEKGKDPSDFNTTLLEQKYKNSVRQVEKMQRDKVPFMVLDWTSPVGPVLGVL